MNNNRSEGKKRSSRNALFIIGTGLFLGFFYVAGYALEKFDNVNFTDKSFY